VIHSWTRALQWHPHVHRLVPGGALDRNDRWITIPRRKISVVGPSGYGNSTFLRILSGLDCAVRAIDVSPNYWKRAVIYSKDFAWSVTDPFLR